jgi:hypothetical protein
MRAFPWLRRVAALWTHRIRPISRGVSRAWSVRGPCLGALFSIGRRRSATCSTVASSDSRVRVLSFRGAAQGPSTSLLSEYDNERIGRRIRKRGVCARSVAVTGRRVGAARQRKSMLLTSPPPFRVPTARRRWKAVPPVRAEGSGGQWRPVASQWRWEGPRRGSHSSRSSA